MVDSNQQVEEPVLPERARIAQKEFNVILDVSLVPLKADILNQKLPEHRTWSGACLQEIVDDNNQIVESEKANNIASGKSGPT